MASPATPKVSEVQIPMPWGGHLAGNYLVYIPYSVLLFLLQDFIQHQNFF